MASPPFAKALARHGYTVAEQLPRAAIVATVDVLACLPTARLGTMMAELPELADFEAAEHERSFGNYSPGRFAWLLGNIQRFEVPEPARGGQKLWEWDG